MTNDPSNLFDPFDRNELLRLIGALSDRTISSAEHAHLQELLRASAEARRLLYLHNDIDAGLHSRANQPHWHKPAISGAPERTRTRPRARTARRNWQNRLIAAAALLLITVLGAWRVFSPSRVASTDKTLSSHSENDSAIKKVGEPALAEVEKSKEPHPQGGLHAGEATSKAIAVVKGLVDVEWINPKDAQSLGAFLEPGLIKINSGLVKIELFSGTSIVLEGPAELKLTSANEVYLVSGRMTTTAPPQAHGFHVETASASFIGEGMEFGLDITRQTVEYHVFKGSVRLLGNDVPIQFLPAGRAAAMQNGSLSRVLAANRSKFVSDEEMNERAELSIRQARRVWLERSEQINNDPALLFHVDFETMDLKDGILPNLAKGSARVGNGAIVGGNRGEGRWPGKSALEFHTLGDRVRLNVPGMHKSITLAASVCVNGLDRTFNSLFMTDGWKLGSCHWQILNDGHVRFSFMTDKVYFYTVDSPIVFHPGKMGKWVHLAVTFDGDRHDVRHYVDGELIRRIPIPPDAKLDLGSAEIGNWNPINGEEVRHFSGRMDEFVLYDRALSSDEIFRQARMDADSKK